MYQHTTNIRMKSTTTLLSSGKRVSWFNVSYLKYRKLPKEEGYEFTIHWKYKAAIKKEIVTSPMATQELNKYFAKFGIVPLKDGVMVNLDNIMIIDEEPVHGPLEKTRVRMVFVDGFEIKEVMVATQWAWWKQTYA